MDAPPERGKAILVRIPEAELIAEIARTPLDQFVIWNGRPHNGRPNSVPTLALSCVQTPWSPIALRMIVRDTARLQGDLGLPPQAVRKAIWSLQSALSASFFLVRAKALGDYVAVTEIPRPSSWPRPVMPGDLVFSPTMRLESAEDPEPGARAPAAHAERRLALRAREAVSVAAGLRR